MSHEVGSPFLKNNRKIDGHDVPMIMRKSGVVRLCMREPDMIRQTVLMDQALRGRPRIQASCNSQVRKQCLSCRSQKVGRASESK